MARLRISKKKQEDNRSTVTDDFIYDIPENEDDAASVSQAPSSSETPDEAVSRFRKRGNSASSPSEEKRRQEDQDPDGSGNESSKPKIYSSGVMLDENLNEVIPEGGKKRRRRTMNRGLRIFLISTITLILFTFIAFYLLHRILPDVSAFQVPENVVSNVITPVQSFFSGITESVFGYFRELKLRANIENEYNALRAENEQLVYKAMLADELQHTLSQYEDLSDEIAANAAMRPIVCTVIGKSDSNYFSTLTINKGLKDGVEDYMAVTISGALVGYTESTQEHKATVRTIIDSDASIAALIQSSRDQGTVRGTLGIDGTPLCRMYYLPDDNLPRPGDMVITSGVGMSFPKGIPIGIVRESTRGMDSNKQYIVLEPQVDFQHLEYVIVLRYKPEAIAVERRESENAGTSYLPIESARPSPVIPEIAANLMDAGVSGAPEPDSSAETTPSPTPEITETPTPSPSPTPVPVATPETTPLEYQVVNFSREPTPTPSPTPEPTPTPYLTPDPDQMTYEEDAA